MKLSIIHTIRTNNFNDAHIMQKITEAWKSASAHLSESENVYGVYHEYQSDFKGDYSLSIAVEDKASGSIEIPHGAKYKVFKVDTEEEQGIYDTWNKIWKQEDAGMIDRAYTFDFEKYYPAGEIEIHIAIQ